MAATAGYNVRDYGTRDTTILVVGIQDKDKLRGLTKVANIEVPKRK